MVPDADRRADIATCIPPLQEIGVHMSCIQVKELTGKLQVSVAHTKKSPALPNYSLGLPSSEPQES